MCKKCVYNCMFFDKMTNIPNLAQFFLIPQLTFLINHYFCTVLKKG